jgi:hypothetical protein
MQTSLNLIFSRFRIRDLQEMKGNFDKLPLLMGARFLREE